MAAPVEIGIRSRRERPRGPIAPAEVARPHARTETAGAAAGNPQLGTESKKFSLWVRTAGTPEDWVRQPYLARRGRCKIFTLQHSGCAVHHPMLADGYRRGAAAELDLRAGCILSHAPEND